MAITRAIGIRVSLSCLPLTLEQFYLLFDDELVNHCEVFQAWWTSWYGPRGRHPLDLRLTGTGGGLHHHGRLALTLLRSRVALLRWRVALLRGRVALLRLPLLRLAPLHTVLLLIVGICKYTQILN